jgi:hypothetical protein
MFYRLQYSRILYKKSDWIDAARRDISQLSPAFWEGLREAFQSKMEHYLSDLGAASCSDDGFFYSVSLAGFVRYTSASLFMANKRLEPSHRDISEKLRELPSLPAEFLERWESLLKPGIETDGMHTYKIAELIALSVINHP